MQRVGCGSSYLADRKATTRGGTGEHGDQVLVAHLDTQVDLSASGAQLTNALQQWLDVLLLEYHVRSKDVIKRRSAATTVFSPVMCHLSEKQYL
jgi:hypothetical protein